MLTGEGYNELEAMIQNAEEMGTEQYDPMFMLMSYGMVAWAAKRQGRFDLVTEALAEMRAILETEDNGEEDNTLVVESVLAEDQTPSEMELYGILNEQNYIPGHIVPGQEGLPF